MVVQATCTAAECYGNGVVENEQREELWCLQSSSLSFKLTYFYILPGTWYEFLSWIANKDAVLTTF